MHRQSEAVEVEQGDGGGIVAEVDGYRYAEGAEGGGEHQFHDFGRDGGSFVADGYGRT